MAVILEFGLIEVALDSLVSVLPGDAQVAAFVWLFAGRSGL